MQQRYFKILKILQEVSKRDFLIGGNYKIHSFWYALESSMGSGKSCTNQKTQVYLVFQFF